MLPGEEHPPGHRGPILLFELKEFVRLKGASGADGIGAVAKDPRGRSVVLVFPERVCLDHMQRLVAMYGGLVIPAGTNAVEAFRRALGAAGYKASPVFMRHLESIEKWMVTQVEKMKGDADA